jgi:hypothetical protein
MQLVFQSEMRHLEHMNDLLKNSIIDEDEHEVTLDLPNDAHEEYQDHDNYDIDKWGGKLFFGVHTGVI